MAVYSINLLKVPNQTVRADILGVRWQIRLKYIADGCIIADVDRDDINIIRGVRLIKNQFIIPYDWQDNGNFLFTATDDGLPDENRFMDTQFVDFLTQDDVELVRNAYNMVAV